MFAPGITVTKTTTTTRPTTLSGTNQSFQTSQAGSMTYNKFAAA